MSADLTHAKLSKILDIPVKSSMIAEIWLRFVASHAVSPESQGFRLIADNEKIDFRDTKL